MNGLQCGCCFSLEWQSFKLCTTDWDGLDIIHSIYTILPLNRLSPAVNVSKPIYIPRAALTSQFRMTGGFLSVPRYAADALPCHIHLPVWLWIMDPHSRAVKKNTSHGNKVLPQDSTHLHKDLPTIVKRRKLKWYGHVSPSAGLSCRAQWKGEEKADRKRGGKTTPGNGQAWSSPSPRRQWRAEKMEETDSEVICGAPTTPTVKGYVEVKEGYAVYVGNCISCMWRQAPWPILFLGSTLEPALATPNAKKKWRGGLEKNEVERILKIDVRKGDIPVRWNMQGCILTYSRF